MKNVLVRPECKMDYLSIYSWLGYCQSSKCPSATCFGPHDDGSLISLSNSLVWKYHEQQSRYENSTWWHVNAAGTKKKHIFNNWKPTHAYSRTQMQTNTADQEVSPFYRITPAVQKPKITIFTGTSNRKEMCLIALQPGFMNYYQNVCVDAEVISPSLCILQYLTHIPLKFHIKFCSGLLDNQSCSLWSMHNSQEINALFTRVKSKSATAEPKRQDDRPEQIKKHFQRGRRSMIEHDKTLVMVKIFMGRRFNIHREHCLASPLKDFGLVIKRCLCNQSKND